MKVPYMVVCCLCLGFANQADADQVIIPGGTGENILVSTINGDTLADGSRVDPNRVYVLEADCIYYIDTTLVVNNLGGTLTIRGQEGGTKPVVIPAFGKDVTPQHDRYAHQISGSLNLQNIHLQSRTPNEFTSWSIFKISGDSSRLHVDRCLFEFGEGQWFDMSEVERGCEIEITNSYFRDLFTPNQWWGSRIVRTDQPVDKLIFTNNTVTGGGMTLLNIRCLVEYAEINHNTFINNHKYILYSPYFKEFYYANNMMINCNWVGENIVEYGTSQDPDNLFMGIVGIDTLEKVVTIQSKFLNPDSSLTDNIDDLNDIIWYASDNVVISSPELEPYYHGVFNDVYDTPVGYLCFGCIGPYQIFNVPGIWMNSRTQSIVDAYDNIVNENNSIYEYSPVDIGMVTNPLNQAVADVAVEWNRVQWGAPDAIFPTDMSAYYFGDNDPNTIPGIGTEDGAGITKISDLVEDFSYSMELISKSDGLPIGAQHWFDLDFDAGASLSAVKAAYDMAVSIEKEKEIPDDFSLAGNYPNPFNPITTIRYSLDRSARARLTVYNVNGQQIAALVDSRQKAGTYESVWDATGHASGVYLYTLEIDGQQKETRRMVLMK